MSTSRDEFLETIIAQYRDEIEEILVESEQVYRSSIDYDMLDTKVQSLIRCAKVDGLNEKMIWELLEARIPTYVNYINFKNSAKKAA